MCTTGQFRLQFPVQNFEVYTLFNIRSQRNRVGLHEEMGLQPI